VRCVNRIVAGCWTPAKGSCQQNLAYCSKEGSARVMGEIPSVVPFASCPKGIISKSLLTVVLLLSSS